MKKIGIVTEYNPFHNGHKYQIKKIKEIYPDSLIIVVMSSSFTERGEYSLLDKWTKTNICLENDIDLVVELPYIYSSQSADIFAYGAISLLNNLNVDIIAFGSESNDKERLIKLAKTQINNKEFDILVKKYMDNGNNYPTSLNKALKTLINDDVTNSNDLLNVSYIKEILKQNKNIEILPIKRTNEFNDIKSNDNIISASNIRQKLMNNIDIKKYVPNSTYKYIKNININEYDNNYFNYLKYKINSSNDLSIYNTVDEGIENRIKKYINTSNNIEELIESIKTKRYTTNKIKRMLNHILNSYTKDDNNDLKLKYIRILGFNKKGQEHLKIIKKNNNIPIITKYNSLLEQELKITKIYSLITNNQSLIEQEYKNKPIIK